MENSKLSTILFIDIEGYTALMQTEEKKALSYLGTFKDSLERVALQYDGRIVQFYGDGCLLTFDSTRKGVDAAILVQKKFIEEGIPVRIGIHLGEVVFREANVFGDGVNIASRIESIAVPGSVLFSGSVKDQIRNKDGYNYAFLGPVAFKNIENPLDVFAFDQDGLAVPDKSRLQGKLAVKNETPARKWAFVAAGLLLLAVLVFAGYKTFLDPGEELNKIPKLAVIDFRESGRVADDKFADILMEELNEKLSGLRNLAVISRNSTSLFDQKDDPFEIGRELDVDYVLDGLIEWTDDNIGSSEINIRPRLLRISDNAEIWKGMVSRELSVIRNAQVEISKELLARMDVAINLEEETMLSDKLTSNLLALDAYRKGLKVKPPGHGAEVDFRTAFTMFRQSVTIDPEFALGWVALSYVYKDLYWYGYETSGGMLDSALTCLERARNLEPDHPKVTIGFGDYYYRTREFDKSLAEFSKVIAQRPNDNDLLQRIGEVWRRQGYFDQAIETLEKALSLDPYNVNSITELAWTYLFVGDFERAFELHDQGRKYNPDAEWNHLMGTMIYWDRAQEGDLEKARELLENVPNPQSSYPAWFWITQSIFENDNEAVLRLLNSLSINAIELQSAYSPVSLIKGLAHLRLGNLKEATQLMEQSILHLNTEIEKSPEDFRLHVALGLSHAGLGNREEAQKAANRAVGLLPIEKDHLLGLDILYGVMRIHALLGDVDDALDVMARMYSLPCQYRGYFFTKNPEFEQLRNSVRFTEIIKKQDRANKRSVAP